jgi:integrase
MLAKPKPRVVLIRPIEDFGTFDHVLELAQVGATAALKPRFFYVPKIAILVGLDGMPIWAPTLYLAERALYGRSVKGDTVRSYAEALQTWLAFLDDSDVALSDVTEDVFAVYRSELAHFPRPHNGRVLASATANHRISVVCNFHLWGQRRGLDRLIATHRGSRSSLAPSVIYRLPRLLSYDEIGFLFKNTRSPYRLIFKWALLAGMRRFEICDLTMEALPTPEELEMSRDRFVRINIIRKGSRNTTVHVPVFLVEETRWYVLADRPNPKIQHINRVFIGNRGTPIDRNTVSREFRRCANKIGSRATFHHLRHTFAVSVLGALERTNKDGGRLIL